MVNSDGDDEAKQELCRERGIDYVVLDREPAPGLAARSSTEVASRTSIPYRIDLAGGWLDQPWVSSLAPGPVVTLSLEPTHAFSLRGGMATSTRHGPCGCGVMRFHLAIPRSRQECSSASRILLVLRSLRLSRLSGHGNAGPESLYYDGEYWPQRIDSVLDEDVLSWLESHLQLVFLYPRPKGFSVLAETNVNAVQAGLLAPLCRPCLGVILARDPERMGYYLTAAFRMQISMFPAMAGPDIEGEIDKYLGEFSV